MNYMLPPEDVSKYGFELPADPFFKRRSWRVAKKVKAARVQVTRVTSVERMRGGRMVMDRVLAVTTETDSIQINVTPTGLIRIYDGRGQRVR